MSRPAPCWVVICPAWRPPEIHQGIILSVACYPAPICVPLISFGRLYTPGQARQLLSRLMGQLVWQDEYTSFDRRLTIPRQQAWHADPGIHYRYSDNMLRRQDWTETLLSVKGLVEARSGHRFNSVLATCYRNGDDYVSWHADDEAELGAAPVIASLSLGAGREFHYRHKRHARSGCMTLHNGELLLMPAEFQHDWEHCVPPQARIDEARLNLTFRRVLCTPR